MEIRQLRDDEREQSFYLGTQAFGRGNRDMSGMNNPNRPPSRTFGVWDDAGLQAKVTVVEFQNHFGPDLIAPLGGIAGVASLPASRGKGYANACLRYTLEQMRDKGEYLSTLFPFSWEFYRRLGWEWVGIQRQYSVPTKSLKSAPETENVRAATSADRSAIQNVYTQFAHRYRGLLARTEQQWNGILDHTEKEFTYTYLYVSPQTGQSEGYLTFRGGSGDETHIREFFALSPLAQRGLLGLLRRHEMQTKKFTWAAPENDALWSQYYHWDIETKIEPLHMGRVVDVQQALSAWKPTPDISGQVTFALSDEAAPWNTGTWRLDIDAGRAMVQRSTDAAQIELDIQALSQAYFGRPTLAELRDANRLTVHNEDDFSVFNTWLSGPPMFTNDFF